MALDILITFNFYKRQTKGAKVISQEGNNPECRLKFLKLNSL